jgi:hypothetical protein
MAECQGETKGEPMNCLPLIDLLQYSRFGHEKPAAKSL